VTGSTENWGPLDRAFEAAVRPVLLDERPRVVLFSGGVDSGLLAWELRAAREVSLFTVGVAGADDLEQAGGAAPSVGLPWEGRTLRDGDLADLDRQLEPDLDGVPGPRRGIFVALAAAFATAPPGLLVWPGGRRAVPRLRPLPRTLRGGGRRARDVRPRGPPGQRLAADPAHRRAMGSRGGRALPRAGVRPRRVGDRPRGAPPGRAHEAALPPVGEAPGSSGGARGAAEACRPVRLRRRPLAPPAAPGAGLDDAGPGLAAQGARERGNVRDQEPAPAVT